MTDSDQSTNYAEYSYEKAVTGEDKLNRVLYIIGVILIILSPLFIMLIVRIYTSKAYFIMYIMPLFLILGIPLAKFFYRYLQFEYKYTVDRSILISALILFTEIILDKSENSNIIRDSSPAFTVLKKSGFRLISLENIPLWT